MNMDMEGFRTGRRPSKAEEDDAIREMFKKDQRPTPAELENFVVTSEYWNRAVELYREDMGGIRWMMAEAAKSRDKATSYRGFLVGASAMGIEPNFSPDEPVLYHSGNFKYSPGEVRGEDKRCAERNVLDAARGQAKVIVAVVIVSKETNTGDELGPHDVLHPCRDCREMFRKYLAEGFMREDTILCNVNDANPEIKMEERTLKELLALYESDTKI